MTPHPASTPRMPWGTYILLLAQALNVTSAVVAITVAALVGTHLASTDAMGTVPYGLQFATVMLCTFPAAMWMKRWGRKPVFMIGTLALMASGALGYQAVNQAHFGLLVASHAMLGVYLAAANFYRFAAVEGLPDSLKPRAMSLVVAGGVVGAFLGPWLASHLQHVPGYTDFALCYAVFVALGACSLLLILLWRPALATPLPMAHAAVTTASTPPSADTPLLPKAAAIYAAACAYLVMTLLMVQSSLVLKGICGFAQASQAIQAHVLAMFVPSFFTGRLISAWGLKPVLLLGFALLGAAALLGTVPVAYNPMVAGLVVLGLGWNLCFVGGSTLLAQRTEEAHKHRWQGINDVLIAACATLGAFTPAPLLAWLGWSGSNLLMLPFCAVGAWLAWQALTRGATKPPGP